MSTAAEIAAAFARVRGAGFVGKAVRLADLDLPRIGHTIGVGEDEIHAVIDVEASGSGFDAKRRPKMLFEPHVFYRNLSGAKRDQAVKAGLAYKSWKAGAYPKESYTRLSQAMAIDETAALKAASWGLGQVLGENFVAAGYDSPQQMVLAFVEGGESEHLAAMIRFITHNRLDDELRRHDWANFARGYNGASYAQHGYHTKLAAAFAKWRKIRDTAWSPDQDAVGKPVPTPPVDVAPLPPLNSTAQAIDAIDPAADPHIVPADVPEPITITFVPAKGEASNAETLWQRVKHWFSEAA